MFPYILTILALVTAAIAAIAYGNGSTLAVGPTVTAQQISTVLERGKQALAESTKCLTPYAGDSVTPSAQVLSACSVSVAIPAAPARAAWTVTLSGCLANYPALQLVAGLERQPKDAGGTRYCESRVQLTEATFIPVVLAASSGAPSAAQVFPASACVADCDVGLTKPFAAFWRAETGAATSYATTVSGGATYYVLLKHSLP